MSKRIKVSLPDAAVAVLDRVASKGNRSRLISQAVLHYVKTRGTENLKERLKEGALANAKLNLEIAEEWFPVEQEAWQRLEQAELATKAIRGGEKSTSRRATRRFVIKKTRPARFRKTLMSSARCPAQTV